MFKNLLSNLPFNPSLVDQIGGYYSNLCREITIRRAGLFFISLALIFQLFASIFPTQKSLASSPNNLLNGISNKNDILHAYGNNTSNIKNVYSKFGITRESIASIKGQKPNSKIKSTDRDYWSFGLIPLADYGLSNNQSKEFDIKVNDKSYYERSLRVWDKHGANSYMAFYGKNSNGEDFWILQSDGSPVFIGPKLANESVKNNISIITSSIKAVNTSKNNSDANGTKVKSNEILEFRLVTTNTTPLTFNDYAAKMYFGSVLQYSNLVSMPNGLNIDEQKNLNWKISELPAHGSDIKLIKVKIKNPVPATNTPSTTSPDYSCKIISNFGNDILINVNCPAGKTIERITGGLPNISSIASLIIGGLFVLMSVFLLINKHIMAKELKAVRNEYISAGGY